MNVLRRIVILALALVLVACGGGGSSGPEPMKPYTSETLGVTLDIPESWVTEEEGDQLSIANSQKSLDAAEIVDGAGLVVLSMPKEDLMGMDDPVEILDMFQSAFLEEAQDVEILQEATAGTIQGQPSASTKFKGEMEGQPGTYEIFVVVGETNLAILMTIDTTDDGGFSETLTKIVNSAEIQ